MNSTVLNRVQSDAGADIRLELVGYVSFPAGYRGVAHSHPFWEVIFVGGGQGALRRTDGIHPCGCDDVVLVGPGERHQFLAGQDGPLDQLYVGFSFQPGGTVPPKRISARALPSGLPLELIRSELRECHDGLKARGRESLDKVRARLLPVVGRLAGLLASMALDGSPEGPDGTPGPVRLAKEFLQSNLGSQLSVAQLAKRFCLSPKYFGESFKKSTGMTLKEYQNMLRMRRARELLTDTDKSVAAVAEEVGMENPAYFARLFRKQFRISARELRREGRPTGA